jgi:plastocyanin
LLKKITIIGTTVLVFLLIVGLVISTFYVEENSEESEQIIKGDVIMPTKVSRPGCEETNRCYVPSSITINPGKQVTWVNEDSAFHSVTSGFYDAPTNLFDSGYLDPFESFTVTFEESGTYDYFCTLHPWMNGQVIVE